jgi:hypothetical protein
VLLPEVNEATEPVESGGCPIGIGQPPTQAGAWGSAVIEGARRTV